MKVKRLAVLLVGVALIAAACSSGDSGGSDESVATEAEAPTPEDGADDSTDEDSGADDGAEADVTPEGTPEPDLFSPTATDRPLDLRGGVTTSDEGVELVAEDARDGLEQRVSEATSGWETEWGRRTVDISELVLGIPTFDPRDRIPPIHVPKFEPIADAQWDAREPGALVQFNDEARFYPLAIMTRHEIVNDRYGDIPVAVTFCPLCNTAVAFDSRVNGEAMRFGVSGLLRNSDLIMWDDSTLSLWQQITGEAIIGELAGTQLDFLPTSIVSYGDAVENFPDALSMSPETGFDIDYGFNGYADYSSSETPFLFTGELDERFPALSRVVGVSIEEGNKAFPFEVLGTEGAINDEIGGRPIVVLWGGDTADALDAPVIADSAAIGSAIAYDRVVDDQVLTFSATGDDTFTDAETGTTWTLLGRAIDGPLAGEQLETVAHRNEFWFAWAAFFPEAPVYEAV